MANSVRERGEVFTPPHMVKSMIDSLFVNGIERGCKILEPSCGTGNFLVEIAIELTKNVVYNEVGSDLSDMIVDAVSGLHGIDIHEPNVVTARGRLVETITKFAHDVADVDEDVLGDKLKKLFDQNVVCDDFLKTKKCFKYIIGNPPYQTEDEGYGRSAGAAYPDHVMHAIDLGEKICMIIPARWYLGGKGTSLFREFMANSRHITELRDYPDPRKVFKGVQIQGGVCYFVWDDKADSNIINYISNLDPDKPTFCRRMLVLKNFDIIRYTEARDIIDRVNDFGPVVNPVSETTSTRCPYGIRSHFIKTEHEEGNYILIGKHGYRKPLHPKYVTKGHQYIDKYNVYTGAYGAASYLRPNLVISPARILMPGEVCTESYCIVGTFDALSEAESFKTYMRTKFARFMVWIYKPTQQASRVVYKYLPHPANYDTIWTDEVLYDMFDLTDNQIKFIEDNIKEYKNVS
ncbi:MAG: hypothetical protein DSY80_06975 [Desulfocapsa sp.]|nr:MAG: hypothetical protein DSY80_06975 [Desulfocapsa sp.]